MDRTIITKKNDLNIDITIATTTSRFTESAIKKANSYGIILEKAECINTEFISKMTRHQFATFTFIYARATNLCFLDKEKNIYSKGQIKKHYTKDQIKNFEHYINMHAYQSENRNNIIKEAQKIYKSPLFSMDKSFTTETKINIEKDHNVEIIANGHKITAIVVQIVILPVNYTVPITSGIITKTPSEQNVKNQIVEYNNDGKKVEFVKIDNQFCLKLAIEKKNPYLTLVSVLDVAITPFVIKNASFKMQFENLLNAFGDLDFRFLW